MQIRIFDKVKCSAYLKKNCKSVSSNPMNDETIENEYEILLGYGDSVTQNIYKIVEKEFVGICVGIYLIDSEREYIENYIDERYMSVVETNYIAKEQLDNYITKELETIEKNNNIELKGIYDGMKSAYLAIKNIFLEEN